jgi:hypothetical protein
MDHSKEEIEYAFDIFVQGIQNKLNEHYAQHLDNLTPPSVTVRGGSKYWKIVTEADNRGYSVFGFVRKEDGAILKPASWRAPFVKGPSAVRGYVTDSLNGMGSVTPYGIVYAN